ncbi:hypothetical protein K488DRAFT_42101 [Vararia minispora EC-137]|uniref:Uncharacterized protein n=1 Tax=Vararia minispora EC-137 TaxID=1314806 RepID=A0ACB8QVV1_9AGAM|nr:hypothetical protein K488DRAFT_42101 [Vararia minispora EC-137]
MISALIGSRSRQDKAWKDREQGSEAQYARQKEQEQLEAIRQRQMEQAEAEARRQEKPYEAGFGGQEDLEDRYATTSGEH